MLTLREIGENFKNSKDFSGNVTFDEPVASKTTFKIGGNASLFISPFSTESLIFALKTLIQNNQKYFILGGGSNIVFSSKGYEGCVISTQFLNKISCNKNIVTCQSGTSISAFVNYCTKNSLSGAEEFAGLPGSVGGAVFMNARCFEKSFSDIFIDSRHVDLSSFKIQSYKKENSHWEYKKSPYQKNCIHENSIITECSFLLNKVENSAEIKEKCEKFIFERKQKGHFKFPSAGSVFKNNHEFGKPSGKIIDEAGLKGKKIGNAQVADFHGNFIVNLGNATSDDVFFLVQEIQGTVKNKFNFDLETEIIFVN